MIGNDSTIVIYDRNDSGLYYKSFTIIIYDCNDSTIVIYDHNDSGLYYKSLTIIIYDRQWQYDCNLWS